VRTVALIPAKPLAGGKSRLSGVLAPGERIALNRALFMRTLGLALRCPALAAVVVASRDGELASRARRHGAACVGEAPGAGLNGALDLARDHAVGLGAEAVLVLPVDLPDLATRDIAAMIAAAAGAPAVAIAPDRRGSGTNALLVAPPRLIGFGFGAASLAAHRAAALGAGVRPVMVRRRGLAFDLDTPDDLRLMPARRRRAALCTEVPG